MKLQKILSIILSLFFAAVLCFLGIKNKDIFTEKFKAAVDSAKSDADLQKELSAVEPALKEKFSYKDEAADIYGLGLMALNKKAVGNCEYLKLKSGETIRIEAAPEISVFYDSTMKLYDRLKAKNIPMIYMGSAEHRITEKEAAASGQSERSKVFTELYNKLRDAGIDTIDPNEEITDIDAYFINDVHYNTAYEFRIAQLISDKLKDEYGMSMPEYEKVFDINSYEITEYPFLGNTGRNSGRFLSGVDTFQSYCPKFETSMALYVYDNDSSRKGTFEQVCMNNKEFTDIYTYWITNFLQYPNGYYTVTNYTSNGPSILFVADSSMLRTMSFMSLECSKITVVDPRFISKEMLNNALQCDYDAVIVGGISSAYYAKSVFYDAEKAVSDLEVRKQEKLLGYYGMWVDTYNNAKPENKGEIVIDRSASTVTLKGWAVDADKRSGLSNMFIDVGGKIIACEFGFDRQSVVDHYDEPGFLKSGFKATFDSSLLYDKDGKLLDSISFILVGNDGTYMYEPVVYKLTE